MKQAVKRTGAAAAASVLLAFICGLAVYQTMGFVYAIADDVIMRDIASGAFTGTPDGHLFFVQYALGRTISSLYRINGRADWYGFFMAGAGSDSLPGSGSKKELEMERCVLRGHSRRDAYGPAFSCGAV